MALTDDRSPMYDQADPGHPGAGPGGFDRQPPQDLAAEQSVVRAGDLSRVNLAFFTINGVIGVLFGAMTIADVYMSA